MTKTDRQFFELHAEYCKCLAHPDRLQILAALSAGEQSFADLLEKTEMSKVNLSRQLSLLVTRGLVRRRSEGKKIFLTIANKKIIRAYQLMTEALRETLAQNLGVVDAVTASPPPKTDRTGRRSRGGLH